MTSTNNTTRRYALAAAILAAAVVPNALAFTTPGVSFHSTTSTGQQQRPTRHIMFSAVAAKPNKSSPVVVSEEAEALSHSDTTLKLQPSYDLFQMLTEEEGGVAPAVTTGNRNRDPSILKSEKGQMIDTLEGIEFSEYIPVDKKTKAKLRIETLPDPFKMVEKELKPFSDSISELVSSDQPILSMAAKHFFEKRHGKRFRPTIVQLVAKAVAAAEPEQTASAAANIDKTAAEGWEYMGASKINIDGEKRVTPENHKGSEVWRKQAQLGQIVEMIHVASLIHDDVLDEADTRRGGEAVHKLYSNKVAVLAGDYLLARASVLLARLENTAVVQIMATALESLVAGEIMQLKSPPKELLKMESYLRKSYYKTASLICYACRSTALLGGHAYSSTVATAAEEFGFHMGLAFQIQDDILDFTAAENVLGKPALADMDLGLSTAPILYAAMEYPQLKPLVMRRFKDKGDKQTALEYLYKSPTAMNKARALALYHADKAVEAIMRLPQSEARDSLVRLTHAVITRKK
jgi:geranylgeranyl pyrophosphate synthase